MNKYGLHAKLMATKGNGNRLASILMDASKLVSMAQGCHLYLVSKDIINEDSIWVTEVWDSKEDHDNSLKVEGVRELISKAIPIMDGQPEKGDEFEVLGGLGVDK